MGDHLKSGRVLSSSVNYNSLFVIQKILVASQCSNFAETLCFWLLISHSNLGNQKPYFYTSFFLSF